MKAKLLGMLATAAVLMMVFMAALSLNPSSVQAQGVGQSFEWKVSWAQSGWTTWFARSDPGTAIHNSVYWIGNWGPPGGGLVKVTQEGITQTWSADPHNIYGVKSFQLSMPGDLYSFLRSDHDKDCPQGPEFEYGRVTGADVGNGVLVKVTNTTSRTLRVVRNGVNQSWYEPNDETIKEQWSVSEFRVRTYSQDGTFLETSDMMQALVASPYLVLEPGQTYVIESGEALPGFVVLLDDSNSQCGLLSWRQPNVAADLMIEVAPSFTTAEVGSWVTHTVTVTNLGFSSAEFEGRLPVPWNDMGGDAIFGGILPAGEVKSFRYAFKPQTTGAYTVTGTVRLLYGYDPVEANNSQQVHLTVLKKHEIAESHLFLPLVVR